ncbi:MAG: hypothetical protein WDM88_09180 [Galbitalea sp.]
MAIGDCLELDAAVDRWLRILTSEGSLVVAGPNRFRIPSHHPRQTGRVDQRVTQTHVDFNSVRYTVSLLFPVANLPDSQAFTTHGPADWLAFFLSVAGWFLAAVVVAALTGLLQRTR